jgi:hypothetical protein
LSWVRTILTLVLGGFWVATSSHVLLESAGIIHQENHHIHAGSGGDRDGSDDHDAADGRCVRAARSLSAPAPILVVLFQTGEFTWNYFSEALANLEASGLAAPDEVSFSISSWRFFRRTALPPRAPSLLA